MSKLLFSLFCFITLALPAQKLTYEVFLFGKKIGTAQIERSTDKEGGVQYLLQSSTVAHVFFTTRRSFQNYIVKYKDAKLVKAEVINTVNDETTHVNVDWDINKYIVKRNGKYTYVKEPVTLSTLCLYFREPKDGEKVFSERLAEYFALKRNSDGSVEYTLSDGIRSIFTYKNGHPDAIQMKKSFITVEMKLVKVE